MSVILSTVADLFDRICRVTLSKTVQTANEKRFFTQTSSRIEIADLRVRFTVKKNLGKSPNECKFTITNLNAVTRTEVEGPPDRLVATLAAGYAGVARHLFTGDVMLAFSEKQGADWETEFTVKDGGQAFKNARLAGSYRAGTPVLKALKDLAGAMGTTLPDAIANDPAFRGEFSGGHVLRDPVSDELTRLLAAAGYSWSIQDGRMQIVSDTTTVGTERIISGGEDGTGMIGSPTFERTKGGKKKGAVTKAHINTLLYPELTPGGVVRLTARSHAGRFRLEEVEHKGDSHGTGDDSWTTSVEAKEIGK